MEPRSVWMILALILVPQLAFWGILARRMMLQKRRIRLDAWRLGKPLVLGPERADYQGWNRKYGVARTMGWLALLDDRLLFVRPLGRDISVSLGDICEVSDTVSCGPIRQRSDKYVNLKRRDGSEVVFIVKDQQLWLEAIRERIAPPSAAAG